MYIYIFEIGKKQREYAFVLTSLFRDYSLIRGFYIYIYIFTYIYIYINKATAERIKKKKSIDDLLPFFFHSPQDGCDNPVSHVLPFG